MLSMSQGGTGSSQLPARAMFACIPPDNAVIEERPGRGRCLIAQRDFQPGDVVFRSQPHAFALLSGLNADHCECCFSSGPVKRCAACGWVAYCGKGCQLKAWKNHHKWECKALKSHAAGVPGGVVDCAILAARTLLTMQRAGPDASVTKEIRGMVYDDAIVKDQRPCARFVCLLLRDYTLPLNPSEEELCRLLAAFQANNFAIADDLLVARGAGVYPAGALLNHSCLGNCVMQYEHGQVQVVRCIQPVAQGEELCHSYVDQASTRTDRLAKLQLQYGFVCTCERCGADGGSLLDRCLEGWRRPGAAPDPELFKDGEFLPPLSLVDWESQLASDEPSPEQKKQRMRDLDLANRQLQTVSPVDPACPKSISACEKALSLRQTWLHAAHLDMLSLLCQLQNLCAEAAEWRKALVYGCRIISIYSFIYPANHPILGLQWYRVGDVCQYAKEPVLRRAAYRRAIACLRVSMGEECAWLSDLREALL
eukprot:m.228472 g.228472  ORF g.228472 m.228472 type:complete len:481 (+) comp22386_c0_seq15:1901-3343(+)